MHNQKLEDIGERKAIERLAKILEGLDTRDVVVGIGDDCAVIDLGDRYFLVTTDMISEKTHIPHGAMPRDIGWHIVGINLSDIAAMGGSPIGMVVALGLKRGLGVSFLEELVKGMRDCASRFNIPIIGGDTKEHDCLTLCGTAFGFVGKREIMLRKGARVGDVVAVTGGLGRGGSSLYALEHGLGGDAISKLLHFHPRVVEGEVLAKTGVVNCCIDISDGLASSIHQLASVNRVGFEISFDKIPVYREAKMVSKNMELLKEMVLYHGGDYELLVTINPEKTKIVFDAVKKTGTRLTSIGIVTEGKENILITSKGIEKLENRGYEHFT